MWDGTVRRSGSVSSWTLSSLDVEQDGSSIFFVCDLPGLGISTRNRLDVFPANCSSPPYQCFSKHRWSRTRLARGSARRCLYQVRLPKPRKRKPRGLSQDMGWFPEKRPACPRTAPAAACVDACRTTLPRKGVRVYHREIVRDRNVLPPAQNSEPFVLYLNLVCDHSRRFMGIAHRPD